MSVWILLTRHVTHTERDHWGDEVAPTDLPTGLWTDGRTDSQAGGRGEGASVGGADEGVYLALHVFASKV